MATQNFRVVGYLSPETYAKLEQFMKRQGLTEAKAIEVIVADYLGTSSVVSEQAEPANSYISGGASSLRAESSNQSPPPDIPSNESMSHTLLADYLNCDPAELANIRDYPVVLADFTKERDPKGKAWEYEPNSGRYFPAQ